MINTTSFAERLSLSLDKEGFPPKHKGRIQLLAELVGLTHRGASKWLNGECTPPARKYALLAKQLHVHEKWLKTGLGPMYDNHPAVLFASTLGVEQMVPIYTPTEMLAATPREHKKIQCILPYRGVFYGIILSSEAMSPRFPVGTLAIMDRYAEAKDGDFVLVHQPGQDEPLFRQLCVQPEGRILLALHPQFESLILASPHDMMGKLVQAIVSF